jgi:hypothetical protein
VSSTAFLINSSTNPATGTCRMLARIKARRFVLGDILTLSDLLFTFRDFATMFLATGIKTI